MAELYSKIIGQGTPLLILHGFLGMGDNWKTLGAQYAENGLQAHLIDQRNHGKSFHSEVFDYDILAEDLKHYIKKNELQSALILGHSMGGKAAMQFACSYPDLTKKLIVADIAPKYYPPHHQEIINGLKQLNFDQIKSRTEADKILGGYISDFGTRQFLLKNLYWASKEKLGFRFNLEVLANKMEEVGENIGAADHYNGPTLFLRGSKSEYIMENDLPEIKRHFPQAQLETIQNAGHWLHAENPKQFFEKSIRFLKA
ncbi:alpha/beta fold hydrolase [Kriegella aquimaris]|uniref:Pimeloyl-ACP methyl ester carboxylesterase n=1 Tax=Kriegella aquimaris TaxID=192904 RepID=A0A1G9VRI2_9FLAO|nr:alpha/beta fold hydrolase [Kriegella aquimaris]SDM74750.1 Pimeloyl-ACP methyl ester carboxylesterase [Kriegella aquimaris]